MERTFVILGAVLMFLAVGAGAFGAHALSGYFERFPTFEATYDTAVRYHMIHGLALFVVAWAATRWPAASLLSWSGTLFFAGVLIFSGSLYLMVFTRMGWLGAITPVGGVAFLGGWVTLLLAAFRGT